MKTRAEELKQLISDLGNIIVKDLTINQCKQIDTYIKYKIELAKIEG